MKTILKITLVLQSVEVDSKGRMTKRIKSETVHIPLGHLLKVGDKYGDCKVLSISFDEVKTIVTE